MTSENQLQSATERFSRAGTSDVRADEVAEPAAPELRRCAISPLIKGVYKALGCNRRWSVGRQIMQIALRLEGGAIYSQTVRELLEQHHGIKVGAYSYGPFMRAGEFPPGVTVGRYASVSYGAHVYLQNHPLDCVSMHPFFYDPRLGIVSKNELPPGKLLIDHDAWIGGHAVILHGCKRVGIGAVIGAGAVVTKDVPDFAIVGGNPAKLIRYRFSEEVMAAILTSRWWEKPIRECARSLDKMLTPVGVKPFNHPLLAGGIAE